METIPETSASHSKEHVHFAAEQLKDHNLEIHVKQQDGQADIHLGFLQVHHHYTICFCVKDTLGSDVCYDERENLHVDIQRVAPTADGNGHELELNFNAHREKLLNEVIHIQSKDKEQSLKLVLHARVLGKGKGTPALKDGIKCFKVDSDEDSDTHSDWQGF
ncbi:adipose-secreted signaling protein homolog [Ostrea edulis]|uniref:adipose-secreted signaling protein homolog n=1 Tax=Ostrea edulis TaxID=37623 RepID=UPI0020964D57|nr:adipose-secreted signaling protein homolog [Ostrea edulis]